MKKIIIISMLGIAAMILAAHEIFAADTYTPYYNLRLPDLDIEDEETPWGKKYNNNFSLIDTGMQSLKTSTSSLTSDVAALKVSTSIIQTQLNAVAVSTGSLYNEKIAKVGDTMTGQLTMNRSSITWTNGGSIENVNRVLLNTSFAAGCTEGALQWNMEDGTAEICMQSGQIQLQIGQELLFKAKMVGTAGLNGQVVAITGASGQRPEIELADADAANVRLQDCVIGVLTENVNQNANGFFNAYGYVRDINTSAFSDGDKVYLSTTAGSFIKTIPSPPAKVIPVGIVIYAHATSGILFVHITNIPSQIVTSSVTVSELYAGTATFSGPVSGISLSEIEDLTADKTFSMANKTLTWNFTNPSGGMTWNFTGAAAGHSLEIMQSGGNPGADMHMLHVQASDTDPTTLHLVPGATTSRALMIHSSGDTTTNPGRMEIAGDGKITWGTGSGATDTNLYRAAADTLKTDDSVIVAGSATISGPLTLNGSSLTVRGGGWIDGAINISSGSALATLDTYQILMGFKGLQQYRHAIHTEHNGSGAAGNVFKFYTWQPSQAATDVGNVLGLTIDNSNVVVEGTATIKGSSFSVGGSTLVVSNGKVGVGITASERPLEVSPIARTTAYDASNYTTWADALIVNPSNTDGVATGLAFINNSGSRVSNTGTGIAAVRRNSSDFPHDLVFITRPISAASAERMRITSTGNVGIGTTNPLSKADIVSSSFVNSGRVRISSSTTDTDITGGNLLRSNYLQIGGREYGEASIRAIGFGYLPAATGTEAYYSPAYVGFVERNAGTGSGGTNGDIGIFTRTNKNTTDAPTERMTVTSAGNVGIGTTAPAYPFVVTSAAGVANTIMAINNASNVSRIGFIENGSATNAYSHIEGDGRSTGYLKFSTNDTERMRILAAGNVGIGDTAPTAKLVVNGNIVSSGTIYAQNGFYGSGVNLSGVGALVSSVTVSVATGTITFSGLDGNSAGVYYMVFASSTGTGGMGYRLNFNGDTTSTNYINAQTNNSGSAVGASSDNSDKLFASAIALGTPMDADGHIKIYRGGNGHIFATGDAVFSDGTSGIWTQNARLVHHSAQTNITSISFLVNNNGFPVGTRVELYRSR